MPSLQTGTAKLAASKSIPGSREAFQEAAKLHDAGKFAQAEELLRDAIARDPGNADLRNARGVMFAAMNRHLDAVWCYRDALAYNVTASGIWTNLGNALTQLKHVQTAVYCHKRAIALSSGDKALLYHNLGTALAEAGHHGEAVTAFTRAIEQKPDYHMARWDRGRSYLYLGNYGQAWPDYEIRQITGQLPAKDLPGQQWLGEPYADKTLVLIVEQGFGDTIWVARYLSRVKALGGELIIECQRELIPLLAGLGVADRFIPRDQPLPRADYYCYLCSLPGLFTPNMGAIPPAPYLTAPSDRVAKLTPLFQSAGGKFRVGIVWSGSTTFKRNQERAQPLLKFFQAFALPGVQLYSLQKGPKTEELTSLPRGGPIIDLAPHLHDFADTAAAITHLDLVIMTDSAVAHLAGAMGKPVWVLLGYVAHWLWLENRTDNPWYRSVRLFRPRAEGDWDHVFDTASVELMMRAGI